MSQQWSCSSNNDTASSDDLIRYTVDVFHRVTRWSDSSICLLRLETSLLYLATYLPFTIYKLPRSDQIGEAARTSVYAKRYLSIPSTWTTVGLTHFKKWGGVTPKPTHMEVAPQFESMT